jgi:hypothetical protein
MKESGNIELSVTGLYQDESLYSVEESLHSNEARPDSYPPPPAVNLEPSGYGDPYPNPFESSQALSPSDNFYSLDEMSNALRRYDGCSELGES